MEVTLGEQYSKDEPKQMRGIKLVAVIEIFTYLTFLSNASLQSSYLPSKAKVIKQLI